MTNITDEDRFKFWPTPTDTTLHIQPGGTELLRITHAGEVIAPSLEAASEAGRVFVESMRGCLDPVRESAFKAGQEAERARVVAWLIDGLDTSYSEDVEAAAYAIERGEHLPAIERHAHTDQGEGKK
jgi:hypothetical protein